MGKNVNCGKQRDEMKPSTKPIPAKRVKCLYYHRDFAGQPISGILRENISRIAHSQVFRFAQKLSMMNFLDSLRIGLAGLQIRGQRLLVAVSGGADSVALLRGLVELRQEFSLDLTAAHLDHMLRGEDSTADAAWVQKLCESLQVPFAVERQNVKALQSGTKQTLEETARKVRYEFLERTAIQQNCPDIALAHTADDQAETILHHILRGTGLSGLRGIPREREISPSLRLVRPLLEVRRSQIETWLDVLGQAFRQDASNTDTIFTRNRLRRELLPMLQQDYNPQVIPALLRLGEQAGEMEEVLNQFAEEQLQAAILEHSPNHCKLHCEPLATKPLAFRRVCFTLLWRQQNWPRKRMTFTHWNQLAELVEENRGAIDLPDGLTAIRRREWLNVEWESG
jgi:tRNA(Ile)-lysidine synthase